MKIYNGCEELIGNTPLVRLTNFSRGNEAVIYAKLESQNPAGSVKDRAALYMINAAERDGRLKAGGTVIEPTSGNTGIGICMLAAVRGYRAIIVMPSNMSRERILTMRAYGAEVVLTDSSLGMSGAIRKAEELKESIPGSIIAGQFENPANPEAHYETTGPEIYRDLDSRVDIFVAGVGTGGTVSGVSRYLKEQNAAIRVIAVEPDDSPVLSGGKPSPHALQGIGAGFVPKALDTGSYDEIIRVKKDEAFDAARRLAKSEGLLVGISSGAALHAAEEISKRPESKGKNIVVLLPDTGARYLSTELFDF